QLRAQGQVVDGQRGAEVLVGPRQSGGAGDLDGGAARPGLEVVQGEHVVGAAQAGLQLVQGQRQVGVAHLRLVQPAAHVVVPGPGVAGAVAEVDLEFGAALQVQAV